VHVDDPPSERVDCADGDVTGNERIGDAGEAAMVQMNVGATDLGVACPEERGTGLEVRGRRLAKLDRLVGCRDDGGAVGGARHNCKLLSRWQADALKCGQVRC
jgi:hypothetical protein